MKRTLLLAALAGAVLAPIGLDTAFAQDPARSCTAYQRKNFGGEAWHLKTNGEAARSHLDNRVSSFKMRSGCRVFAWKGANFTGDRRVFGQETSYVGDDWNDQITSWKCICGNQ